MPIRQRGPSNKVHRHRYKYGLERHAYPPSRTCQVTHRRPTTSIWSPPATGKICDITYYIATNPLCHRRLALSNLGAYCYDGMALFILFRSHIFCYAIRFYELIMYLNNDREHVAICQGISSVSTNTHTSPPLQSYHHLSRHHPS